MSLTFGPAFLAVKPTSAADVTVLTWDNNPVTLATPVAVDASGRVSFTVATPGQYRVNVRDSGDQFSLLTTLSLGPDFDPSNIRSMVDWSVDEILSGDSGGALTISPDTEQPLEVGRTAWWNETTGSLMRWSTALLMWVPVGEPDGVPTSLAFGRVTGVLDAFSVAVGYLADASGGCAVAIGSHAVTRGYRSVSVGYLSVAAEAAVAVGPGAKAQAFGSIAVGTIGIRDASCKYGVAVGYASDVNALYGVGIGPYSYVSSSGAQGLAVGYDARAQAEGAVALGRNSRAQGKDSVAIGSNRDISGEGAIGIGASTTNVSGAYSIQIGYDASTSIGGSIAVGEDASSAGGIAVGPTSSVGGVDAIAIGRGSTSNHAGSVAIGAGALTTGADQTHLSPNTLRVGTDPESKMVLKSTDGTEWAITVGTDGTLTTSPYIP